VILVDSSVWIDYFRGEATPQAEKLDSLLGAEPIATGDLILTEVLQGFVSDRDFNQAKRLLTSLVIVDLAGQAVALKAAENFRALRALGVSVRKTIDTVIATRCIENGFLLLYSDRDFDPFVEHLGLRTALPGVSNSLCVVRGLQLAVNKGGDWMTKEHKSGHSETIVLARTLAARICLKLQVKTGAQRGFEYAY